MTTTVSGGGSPATETAANAVRAASAKPSHKERTVMGSISCECASRSLLRLGDLLREDDDPRPGLVAEVHLLAVRRDGQGHVLAPPLERGRADARHELALRV